MKKITKLGKWIKSNVKTQRGVAEKIGVSQTFIHEILNKGQIPNLILAYKIEQYTKGDVTLYDWIEENMDKVNKVPKKKGKTDSQETTE